MSAQLAVVAPQRSPAPQQTVRDNRRHFRLTLRLDARYMRADGSEHSGAVVNISPGGALIKAEPPSAGERLIVYIKDVGRFEAQVSRIEDDRFAVAFASSAAKIAKTADKLTWIANRHLSDNMESRSGPRTPQSHNTRISLDNGEVLSCRVLDISISGASLALFPKPPVGAKLTLGRTRARIVRHHDEGVGVEFLRAGAASQAAAARH
ncbi:MAG: PilZ domain-containing protein [Pseudomonadota bacterium]